MSKFTISSKSHECPICGDVTGKDRHGDDITLCMLFADAKVGEIVNGHKMLKLSKDGMWGVFKLDNSQEWSDEQREQWRLDRERRKQHQKLESDLRQQQSLSAIERDKEYRKLLDELTLHPEDEKELLRRGFTHREIEGSGSKSVDRYQELKQKYSNLLPGISPNGNVILTNAGWLCPVRNKHGLIVAIQVRLRVVPTGEGRYRWLSSKNKNNPNGQSPHVYPPGSNGGELPLASFYPEGEPKGIAIAEGVGAKPFFVAQRLGMLTVGAAGGQWASSPVTFKESLDHFSQKMNGLKELILYVDSGDVLNKLVIDRWQKTVKLVQEWGWTVRIAWWSQISKKHDDIDELPAEKIKDISYLTPDYFWELAKDERRKLSLTKVLLEDEDLPYGHAQNWQMWLNSRRYTPDIIVNQDEFTFPELPESNVIVAVKSGLGTHKTGAMILTIQQTKMGVRLIGYRNNLLFQTMSRMQGRSLLHHLSEEDAENLIESKGAHLAFCLDSIGRVDGYFTGRDIYLDETCSVILHAVNGGTLGDSQAKIIKIFTRALEVCNRIFLMDGNLSDIYVDFIAKIAKNKRVIKIENQKRIPPHNIKIIEGIDPEGEIKKRDKSALVEYLCSQDVKAWIACDSKSFSKVLDRLLKDLGLFGFCLNSETAGEEWAKQFMQFPDLFIEARQPDYMIVSPTAESGVSVTTKYFTDKMTFFVGVQATNAQHQQMFRLRDNSIPHYVVCPQYSAIEDRSTPKTYSAKRYQEISEDRINQSAIMAAYDSGNPERVTKVIAQAIARQQDEWWHLAGQLGVLDHFEMQNLRLCLIHALEDAGHKVEILNWSTSKQSTELIKETREIVEQEHAQEIFRAEPYPTIEEANQIAKITSLKHIQRRVEKTRLLDRLPEIENSDAYSADFIHETYVKDRYFISQQQRFYFLNNFEVSQKRHEVDWFYKATASDFFSGRLKKITHLDIWALRELNVLQFIRGSWHKDMPEVISFIEKARQPEIVKALNMKPKPDSATGQERIEYVSRLLGLIGLKFAKPEQRMLDGVRQRVYTISSKVISNPSRLAVLEAIDKKMTLWMSQKGQVDWSEQPFDQRIQESMAGWMPEQAVEQPIQSPSNAVTSLLHSTPPTDINHVDSVESQPSDLEFVDTNPNIENLALSRDSTNFSPILSDYGWNPNESALYISEPVTVLKANLDGTILVSCRNGLEKSVERLFLFKVKPSDRREEVFMAWVERDTLAREKAAPDKLEAQKAIVPEALKVEEVTSVETGQDLTVEQVMPAVDYTGAVVEQSALSSFQQIKLDEIKACESQANEQTNDRLPSWVGLKLKLQQGLQGAGRFYQEAVLKIGESIGIADSEPFWNAYLNRWQIAVNFACGCKSVAFDWVVIA
ncbi:plasmid replication protein, CyRepA1 family [Nostoc sp. WHI]|uniref:plasmid replication protein, CyRepA1 family n=1 Tax=Nostoc sp. WHI TaxID=2650611 RepID=UPI0018C624D3|nr:plasmid replication protein, CyRepA1 family [Nostoc sp. WHI]MBG1268111.1 hypothetical protein [Nostoc sp. WHI]